MKKYSPLYYRPTNCGYQIVNDKWVYTNSSLHARINARAGLANSEVFFTRLLEHAHALVAVNAHLSALVKIAIYINSPYLERLFKLKARQEARGALDFSEYQRFRIIRAHLRNHAQALLCKKHFLQLKRYI